MERAIVFGAGTGGINAIHFITLVLKGRYDIIAVADNDSRKWGKSLLGYPIVSIDDIVDFAPQVVLLASTYSVQIKKQLIEKQIFPEEDIVELEESAITASFFAETMQKDPTNPRLHSIRACCAALNHNYVLAFAEQKSAYALGEDSEESVALMNDYRQQIRDLLYLDYNRYSRYFSLAEFIKKQARGKHFSVLDVGGGEGMLSVFLPDCKYCLAEPTINGISGLQLPFDEKAFDFVVACHVLEHVPEGSRELFLDNLHKISKHGVVLLNPFENNQQDFIKAAELTSDLTQSLWAKEHVECGFPNLEYLEFYAKKRSLGFISKGFGNFLASLSFVFVDFYGAQAGKHCDLDTLNFFVNSNFKKADFESGSPEAHIVFISNDLNLKTNKVG